MTLNNQQQRVYDFLLEHPGSTAREITNATYIDARARMSEMRTHHGVVFKEVGYKRLGSGKPFKMYEIEEIEERCETCEWRSSEIGYLQLVSCS